MPHRASMPKSWDIGAVAAEPLPRLHRQVLHLVHADAAIDRHALVFHETIVGAGRTSELRGRRSRPPWIRVNGSAKRSHAWESSKCYSISTTTWPMPV